MSTPDPASERTPGPERGRKVPPGETPPAEGGISGISYQEPNERGRGWAAMPLTLIMLVVVLVAIGLIAMAVAI